MNHALEWKFIYSSVHALFALRLETIKAFHYITQEFYATNFSERTRKQTE